MPSNFDDMPAERAVARFELMRVQNHVLDVVRFPARDVNSQLAEVSSLRLEAFALDFDRQKLDESRQRLPVVAVPATKDEYSMLSIRVGFQDHGRARVGLVVLARPGEIFLPLAHELFVTGNATVR